MQAQWKKTALFLLLGLGLIAFMMSFVGVGNIFSIIRRSSLIFVALGFIAASLHILLFSFNWYIVLDHVGYKTGLWKLIQVFYAGTFTNNITPLGQMGGEPIMAYILSNNSDISYERSFAGLFAADSINALPFFTYSFLGITYLTLFYPFDWFIRLLTGIFVVIGIVIFSLFLLFWSEKEIALSVIVKAGSRLQAVAAHWGWGDKKPFVMMKKEALRGRLLEFRKTFTAVFSHKSLLFESMIITHAAGILNILALYSFLLAVGWKINFFLLMAITPMSVVAFYMPLPGGLGGVEIVLVTLLVIIGGVPPHIASAAVILHRVTVYLLPTLIGAGTLWYLSSGWHVISRGTKNSRNDDKNPD